MNFKSAILLIASVLILGSCTKNKEYEKVFKNPALFSNTVNSLTDIITYDIFNPPIASRIYTYSSLAAYEVMASGSNDYASLASDLKGFVAPPTPSKPVNYELSSLLAFISVGREMTFSKDSTQQVIDGLLRLADESGMPEDVKANSKEYADTMTATVLRYAKGDNYGKTRSAVKYTVTSQEGRWVPTPPAYMKAVEPSWMKIRPILLDSAGQFEPRAHSPFSKEPGSAFYKIANEVYTTGTNLTDEQKAIADFWDCNGFKLHVQGHVMFGTKAMTPGGHWMGITGIVCKNKEADFNKTVYTFTGVSFALMDGFISCWNTKFKYNLIRPESYINLYINNSWKPYLQTPPFPEYTSGHSVISSAVSVVLDGIYGENTKFTDNTERRWGWPDREFKNVKAAASEAALSRLYGGIHYREAIEVGLKEGSQVGSFILHKMTNLVKK
jgi:hypothetical protein